MQNCKLLFMNSLLLFIKYSTESYFRLFTKQLYCHIIPTFRKVTADKQTVAKLDFKDIV